MLGRRENSKNIRKKAPPRRHLPPERACPADERADRLGRRGGKANGQPPSEFAAGPILLAMARADNWGGDSAAVGRWRRNDALQRVQILDQVIERQAFLLGLLGHAIDLFKGRDAACDFQHPVGVKR